MVFIHILLLSFACLYSFNQGFFCLLCLSRNQFLSFLDANIFITVKDTLRCNYLDSNSKNISSILPIYTFLFCHLIVFINLNIVIFGFFDMVFLLANFFYFLMPKSSSQSKTHLGIFCWTWTVNNITSIWLLYTFLFSNLVVFIHLINVIFACWSESF